ncbi:MAG: type II toxin-antitoxin system RelE/ParE family toxin [Chitinophaga sp.]
MVKTERIIVWDPEAINQLKKAYHYIQQRSPRNAVKVLNDIQAAVAKLLSHPERHSPDKYKLKNDGTYRAFEKHGYRLAYRVLEKEIRILRFRHTAMEPLPH